MIKIDADDRKRLVALELRLSKFGFAVFEEPATLLDWGVSQFGGNKRLLVPTVSNRIEALLSLHAPLTVVVRSRNYHSAAANGRFARIVQAIRVATRRNSASVNVLTTHEAQRHFNLQGHTTKFEISVDLARQFEELSWKLPHRRKSYESEHSAMLIFDAVATGTAFLARDASRKERAPANS